MASRKRLTLDAWIHDALNDDKDNRKCSQISLVHMIGQTPKELHSVKFGSKAPAKAEDLAVMFRQRAEGYAQDLSGTQMFQLLAFTVKTSLKGLCHLPYRLMLTLQMYFLLNLLQRRVNVSKICGVMKWYFSKCCVNSKC